MNPAANIRLRPVTLADVPELFRQQSDPESNTLAGVKPRSREAFEAKWQSILADPTVTPRAIIDSNGELVGSINCFMLDGQPAVGYWIAREHWNKGYATRGLALLLQEVTTRPLYARIDANNKASMKVLQRCGFVVTHHQKGPEDDRYLPCEEACLILR